MGPGTNFKAQTKKIAIVIIAVLVLGLIGFKLTQKNSGNKKTGSIPASSQPGNELANPQKTEYLSYQGENGKTALDLLKSQAEIETKSSSLGDYVTSINGNDGGGSKFWLFYIDGKEASVGADKYTTKAGETIEWKLQ